VVEDFERCYRAVQSRDQRFDGWFYTAVTTTGIYCRPSCPAVTPKPGNVMFYATAAACQAAGFRACRRCRPDAAPGSPEWNTRADVVGRAMRLIADGVVDRDGVAGLARRLGYSPRHLHRQLAGELGVGPIALARSERAHTARLLLETTDLPCGDIAFAAGFGSIRQFNDTVRAVYALPPTALRGTRHRLGKQVGPRPARTPEPMGGITLRLPYRVPFHGAGLLAFLGERAVDGVEQWDGHEYRRTLTLPHGTATVALAEGPGHIRCRLTMSDRRDLATAVERARRLLDLDADPAAVAEHLGGDPMLAAAVAAVPGRRIPGSVDGAEIALRAVLGQQVSVVAGRRLATVLTKAWGRDLPGRTDPAPASAGGREEGPARLFPTPAAIAELDPAALGMPAARGRALVTLARALAGGGVRIDSGADRDEVQRQLLALPGIGPWTAAYIALRGLGDPDAFLPSDLGVRRALARRGVPSGPADAARMAERWRPWRGYALMYLWAAQ